MSLPQSYSYTNIQALVSMTLEDAVSSLVETLGNETMAQHEMRGFRELMQRYLKERSKKVDFNLVKSLPNDRLVPYHTLSECPSPQIKEALSKLVVLKLNGGLGTTMGCIGPKSIIEVRADLTFLDMTIRQIQYLNQTYGCNVPLVLMNSFNTEEETAKVLRKYENSGVEIQTFSQSRYPRVSMATLQVPIVQCDKPDAEPLNWYPPGHGDVYGSFYDSGLLAKFINKGKEYIFISNIDNLGATVDVNILSHMLEKKLDFAMELTDKTRADIKGGTLVEVDGKVKLLELAQVPPAHVEEFKSLKKFKVFNTNNLWVSMSAIKQAVDTQSLNLDIIVNKKTVDGQSIIQLETAAGAAIGCFEHCCGFNVPRSRFLPVKGTSDLLSVQSNLYDLRNGTLVISQKREFPGVPLVKLGDFFKHVSGYQKRLAGGIPDVLELDHLTVSGDVTFGSGVVLKGTVIIVARPGDHIDIPSGSMLENKVVTGDLRIMEH